MASSSDNQIKAPLCAAFVKEMRAVFGEIEVWYVKENDVLLGEPDAAEAATCYFPRPEKKK